MIKKLHWLWHWQQLGWLAAGVTVAVLLALRAGFLASIFWGFMSAFAVDLLQQNSKEHDRRDRISAIVFLVIVYTGIALWAHWR
jgi:fructose-specific phosphotransferase system IIC component